MSNKIIQKIKKEGVLMLDITKKVTDSGKFASRNLYSQELFTTAEEVAMRKDVGMLGQLILTKICNATKGNNVSKRFNLSDTYLAKKHGFIESTWANKRRELVRKGYLYMNVSRNIKGGEDIDMYIAIPCVNEITAEEFAKGIKKQPKPKSVNTIQEEVGEYG